MQFLNFKNDGLELKITFPLVYLHGKVLGSNHAKSIDVNGQKWPIIEKEWKVFLYVHPGDNKFVFKCNDEVKDVIIRYEKVANKRFVQPVYIICKNSDGSFIAPDAICNTMEEAIKKIKLNVRLIQTYFGESLYEYGFERKSFHIAEDLNGEPSVDIFVSSLDINETMDMKPDDLYSYFSEELSEKLPNNPYCKFLCFMSCTRYFPPVGKESFTVEELMSFVRGHAALGGGNMALFGTGSFHTWASSLEELSDKFTDETVIDRTKLFDDSYGRGSHWANYSTTIGATVHELGHCFDLAHTEHGIMCRGHDDMNYFYTIVSSSGKESSLTECPTNSPVLTKKACLDVEHANSVVNPTKNACNASNETIMLDDEGKYKGAHWYRSSAVLLNYHKWFNCYSDRDEEDVSTPVVVSLHPNLLAPVGNMGTSAQKDQVHFNSKKWLRENDLNALTSVVFYYDEYLEGVQFVGAKYMVEDGSYTCVGDASSSPIFGCPSEGCKKIAFQLQNALNEQITSVSVRSGAWIDGLQLTTNLKSSTWIGGNGGDITRFEFKNGRSIDSWIGTAGKFVGSLGFSLTSNEFNSKDATLADRSPETVTFESSNGIRLIELYDNTNGEVCYFQDFSNVSPPLCVDFDWKEVINDVDGKTVSGTAWDDRGNKINFRFDQLVFDTLQSLA